MAIDTWFYVSAGGFLASLILWPYLFVQYRKASRHEEQDADLGAEPLVPIDVSDEPPEKMVAVPASALKGVQPVTVVSKTSPGVQRFNPVIPPKAVPPGVQVFQPAPSAKQKASSGQTQPPTTAQPAPRPVIQPGSTAPPGAVQKIVPVSQTPSKAEIPAAVPQSSQTLIAMKTGQTIPGGISPAVMYLQGVKTQLERLDKEMRLMKDQISHITQSQEVQFGTILRRLEEVKKELVDREFRAQPEPQAEPAAEAETESAPELAAAESQTSAPVVEIITSQETTEEPASSPQPEDTQPPKTGRKGPVWPV